MKKDIFIYIALFFATLVTALGFSGCDNDDDNSVVLEAFGPSPALRGGDIRFLGRNLDKVKEIILPDNISVTDITVVSTSEIKITLPQDVVPGYVVLKTDNESFTTKTKLTLSEPISIEKFYKKGTDGVTNVKAGDELVIEGDYLNLIREVIFMDNVAVSLEREDGEEYPRESLSVIVPLGSQTGKISLSNGAEIPIIIFSEEELTVETASVSEMTPATVKAGNDLTIKGKNLQLIEKVIFESSIEVVIPQDEDIYADITELIVPVPANAKDGAVTLVSYSGLEVSAGDITMVIPAVTSIEPVPVKGGSILTIKGKDLDLVTNITFPNVEDAVVPESKSETQLTVKVPVEAADGKLILNTESEKTVEYNLTTVKSTITSINPTALTAGENITIAGTNLDLVRSVEFGGGDKVEITPTDATSFIVTVPTTATSGKVILHLANGVTVTSEESLNVTPSTNPVVTTMPDTGRPNQEITIAGANLNTVETVYFGTVKVTSYSSRTATSMTFTIPADAPMGTYKIKLVNYSGQEFLSNASITVAGVEPVEDLALVIFDFEDRNGNNAANNAGGWGGIANGKSNAGDGVSGDFFEITSSNWDAGAYWWVADNWIEAPYPSISGLSNYVLKMDVRLRQDITADGSEIKLRIAGNKEANFLPYLLKNGVWTTGGEWMTITVPLSAFSGLDDPTATGGDWGIVSGWNPNGISFVGFCVDNIRYHKIN